MADVEWGWVDLVEEENGEMWVEEDDGEMEVGVAVGEIEGIGGEMEEGVMVVRGKCGVRDGERWRNGGGNGRKWSGGESGREWGGGEWPNACGGGTRAYC